MTDEELVQAIENIVNSEFKASEKRMTEKISSLDTKLGVVDVEMGTLGKEVNSLSGDVDRTLSLLKNDIAPSLRKLAEDYSVFAKKDDRLDKMADDVKEIKTSLTNCVAAVTQNNQFPDGD